MNNYRYKIVIVGDAEVGKTAFVKRLLTGEFEKSYVATLGTEVHPLVFYTNYGVVTFNVWEIAGRFPGNMVDAYYVGAVAGIVMFDVTSQESYDNVPKYVKKMVRLGVPANRIVVVGTKVDDRKRVVLPKNIKYPRENRMQYYDVSSRSNYNFEKPFWYLARKLTGRDELEFVEAPELKLVDDLSLEDPKVGNIEDDIEDEEFDAPDSTWNSMEVVVVHGLSSGNDMCDD